MSQLAKIEFIINLAKKAGAMIQKHVDKIQVTHKEEICYVSTDVDKKVEDWLVKEIKEKFPDHSILREEKENIHQQSDYIWTIDPIDGTRYYIHGVKFYTVSIALWYRENPILGVIYNPGTRDCFWAKKGEGAHLNGKSLRVSQNKEISNSFVCLGVTTKGHKKFTRAEKLLIDKRLLDIYHSFYRIRVLGCGSLSLCQIAQGYLDVYFDLTGREQIVDIGAGIIIAQEAGARVTNLDNKFPGLAVKHVVVANTNEIHKQFLKLMKR